MPARRAGGPHLRAPAMTLQPTLYLPHGGGPCFFMDWSWGPPDTWHRLAAWLGTLGASLPERPAALLVVSAHWEAPVPTCTTGERPALIYDYEGFPPHTYELEWPAPGAPALTARVQALLAEAGLPAAGDATRGFDHGVFVPLKVAFPAADVPTVALSLQAGLDPAAHLAIGRALAPLRAEGVLLVGSGMSYHNLRAFMTPRALADSRAFDEWLTDAVTSPRAPREVALAHWDEAPAARASHPRAEHLLPLMVAAGAGGEAPGRRVFGDEVMGAVVSAFRFD